SGRVRVSMKVRRGVDIKLSPGNSMQSGGYTYTQYLSERPDYSDEYLVLEYLSRDGAWEELGRFDTDAYSSGWFSFEKELDRDKRYFHPGFKLRVRLNAGSGSEFDWWFVESIKVMSSRNEA